MSESALERITRARVQLMLRHPYLASAAARLPLIDGSSLEWCGTLATDGYNIFMNPTFVASLSEEETIGVLAHEIMHCVLGHIDRRGDREPGGWNLAIDYATNAFLLESGFTLPAGGLFERSFRGLTAEDIYDRLPMVVTARGGRVAPSARKGRKSDRQAPQRGQEIGASAARGFDEHLDPGDPRGAIFRGKDFPTAEERKRLRDGLGRELLSGLSGVEAGYLHEEIRKAGREQVPWQALLARFVTGLRTNDYRTYPFNRKHLWRGIMLPSMGVPGPKHIVVAIDTSGSMGHQVLGGILKELDSLRAVSQCRLTLLECDAGVRREESFEAWELTNTAFERRAFAGRGGTDFRPVFRWLEKRETGAVDRPDCLVYMTDGYGTFPDRGPPLPVLWIVPKSGIEKAPFGSLIKVA